MDDKFGALLKWTQALHDTTSDMNDAIAKRQPTAYTKALAALAVLLGETPPDTAVGSGAGGSFGTQTSWWNNIADAAYEYRTKIALEYGRPLENLRPGETMGTVQLGFPTSPESFPQQSTGGPATRPVRPAARGVTNTVSGPGTLMSNLANNPIWPTPQIPKDWVPRWVPQEWGADVAWCGQTVARVVNKKDAILLKTDAAKLKAFLLRIPSRGARWSASGFITAFATFYAASKSGLEGWRPQPWQWI